MLAGTGPAIPGAFGHDLMARAEGRLAAVRAAAHEALGLATEGVGDGFLWFVLGDTVGAAADAAVVARCRRRPDGLAEAPGPGRPRPHPG